MTVLNMSLTSMKFTIIFILLYNITQVISIQLTLQEGEESKVNNVENTEFNDCISIQRDSKAGVCFAKELLSKLNKYDELDSFSLATGVKFVRDEKTPRSFGHFLDKDPTDFRSIMEDASELISKRSLHWDLSTVYPGLVMKIGPTLSNGILEFIVDPRIKDRAIHQQGESLSTGRLLARNFLVPFLLGFKFQISTLLPLLLGLLLLATKKAFFLTKLALLAVTIFGGGFGSNSYGQGSYDFGGPALSSYTSWDNPGVHHGHFGHGGYHHRPYHHSDYFFKEKSSEQTTAAPISPEELRDRLERFFITKKDDGDEPREDVSIRNARNFAWTPINSG